MICPRCKGTGREHFRTMLCATCHGTGETDKEICPRCLHPMSSHDRMSPSGILDCNEESSSGQFMCGCSGPDRQVKPICNVCGKDQGNLFCLNRHLSESPECMKKFKKQYWRNL